MPDNKSVLYLIPTPLGETNIEDILPSGNLSITNELRYFVVEQIRTARRFLRKINPSFPIDDCHFFELNEHTRSQFKTQEIIDLLQQGYSVGLLSEAGLPCVADPGNIVVAAAQEKQIKIKPLVGPSSLMLGLMASGFCGQNFMFHGYLPANKYDLATKIKQMESNLIKFGTTQIFIETPYRNIQLFNTLLNTCHTETKLCIACQITLEDEWIVCKRISEWKKSPLPDINKKPAVFLLG